MDGLILLGAGGMCKEVISLVDDINRHSGRFEILGILDDDPTLAGKLIYGYPVLGLIGKEYMPEGSKSVLCVATHRDIAARSGVAERLGLQKDRWAGIIHPQATVATDAKIENGAILYPGSRVGPNTSVGHNAFLYYNAVLHHDSHLGDYTQVCAGVLVAGCVTVGKRCYLGIGSVIRDNITVADDTFVGMGAVVTQDIREPGKIVSGLPARSL